MRVSFHAVMLAATAAPSIAIRTTQVSVSAYEAFRREFGIARSETEEDYHQRVALFQRRSEEVERHNARPGMGWVAAVNRFSDYTHAEFNAMLGHRLSRGGRADGAPSSGMAASLLESQPERIAQSVDWRTSLNSSREAKDQGGCGSCWAVAAAGAIETRAELWGGPKGSRLTQMPAPEVSYEQLVDCVQNPKECGGKGGCAGATVELALAYVLQNGIGSKSDYTGYQSGGGGQCKPPSHPTLTIKSWKQLPVNDATALEAALTTGGTVAVSADASGWGAYNSGVFHGCQQNATINHAILAMGYGHDDALGMGYWIIRNSWGSGWGENGHIRLLKHKAGETFCGTDHAPLEGVGCKGGPATMEVCGECGILADSAHPEGVQIAKTV